MRRHAPRPGHRHGVGLAYQRGRRQHQYVPQGDGLPEGERPGVCPIEATADTSYFQIGEFKYGKPILDRVITRESSLEEAAKCALTSMDSTIRSNLSVGLPIDLVIIRNGEFGVVIPTGLV